MDLPAPAISIAAVVGAYLVGAIPFGFIVVKSLKGVDIRSVGSGNIGATNVARLAGMKVGMLVLLLDIIKGFLPVTVVPFAAIAVARGSTQADGTIDLLRRIIAEPGLSDLRILCGLAAIAGHVWTVFLRFKGGKGVATALGVLLGLAPWATLSALFLWAVVVRTTGYVSVGSMTAAVALPVVFLALYYERLGDQWRLFALTIVVSLIVIVRHRGNIKRLISGHEERIPAKWRGGRRA